MTYRGLAGLLTLLLAGCASEAVSTTLGSGPQHLGAALTDAEMSSDADIIVVPAARSFGHPLSSRVLSAIAFERTTGLEAHPSRIIPND